ncbi:FHA domain-containing protein [Piscinibacter koreensis]|uniref:FHA domain-containing protein n=1 Tax=Piscinibacter koreensis TaxID=2742824 RepID=A0A7Y6TUS2_9BURK|nr:FHA domain-containing protein [Schlegelella koreensis]NUZ04278.1 FHA domain-containing protein [Schlegelella koreensis]
MEPLNRSASPEAPIDLGTASVPGDAGAPALDPATPAHAATPTLPALVEALDRDGQVRQAWHVTRWPLAIGRALDNDVVLTDPHVAAHHVALDARRGTLVVDAGETRNGVVVGDRRVRGGERAELAAPTADVELTVGRTHLRLRLPGTALAPEQLISLVAAREPRRLTSVLLALLLLGGVGFGTWLASDPVGFERALGNTLITSLGGAAIWCAAWALLSKTITRQSHLGWHVRVFLIASLAFMVASVLPPLVAFAFSWPAVSNYDFVLVYLIGATAVYFHLLAIEPARARVMRGVAITGALVGIGLAIWSNLQRTDRAGDELYMNHLFPPSFRVAPAHSVDAFIDGMRPLQGDLERRAAEPVGAGDPEPANDDE